MPLIFNSLFSRVCEMIDVCNFDIKLSEKCITFLSSGSNLFFPLSQPLFDQVPEVESFIHVTCSSDDESWCQNNFQGSKFNASQKIASSPLKRAATHAMPQLQKKKPNPISAQNVKKEPGLQQTVTAPG